ncbi:MAG TPA: hypothetical protein VGN97_13415 [Mesorhizobium sp.]|nr:hypothetical protein [Mesorhizobium sp.]
MFDRSEILKDAWRRFRNIRRDYKPWQIERGHVDGSFAHCLRTAWRIAKENAAKEAAEARLATGPNAERAATIRQSIEWLNYAPAHMNVEHSRAALQAELAALAA